MATQTPTPLIFVSCKQVTGITTLSKTAIYSRLTPNPKRPSDYDPTFPKMVRIGANRVAWVKSEVEAWAASKVQASRTESTTQQQNPQSRQADNAERALGCNRNKSLDAITAVRTQRRVRGTP